jgi:hypothetical protein
MEIVAQLNQYIARLQDINLIRGEMKNNSTERFFFGGGGRGNIVKHVKTALG